eukprot:321255_1
MAKPSSDEQTQNIKQSAQGSIQWKVTGDLLNQFKSAKHKQFFYSEKFKTIDGTNWKIKIYPQSTASTEGCSIFLQCVTFCVNKTRIGVNYSFNIVEVDWTHDGASTFRREGQSLGKSKAFKSEKLNDLSALTVECVVEETMDVTQKDVYFEWKVSNYLLQKWKNAKPEQIFVSPKFDTIGGEWRMEIYPNGIELSEGTAALCIGCYKSNHSNDEELNVCYYVDVIPFDSQIDLDGNTIDTKMDVQSQFIVCDSPFLLKDIQNESSITIGVKLWQLESIDQYETQFLSNLYSNKMQSPIEWRQYFITETHRVSIWLLRLGLSQYASIFTENKCFIMQQLSNLNLGDLRRMGVKAQGARKRIVAGIDAFFTIEHNPQNNEHHGQKQNDPNIKQSYEEQKQDIARAPLQQGSIHWEITGDLLDQFKNAKPEQLFVSPAFKTSDGTIWRIQFYPYGHSTPSSRVPDHCSIYLECVTLKTTRSWISVIWSVDIMEVNWSRTAEDIFRNDGEVWGSIRASAFNNAILNNVLSLTVECTCIVDDKMDAVPGNTYFDWKVSKYMLQKWKKAKCKQMFCSHKFNAIGCKWYLMIIPNGTITEGIAHLAIFTCHP